MFYFLLVISVLLAIPTFGISLVIFFIAKNWHDNTCVRAILGAIASSIRTGRHIELRGVNRAAIRKIYSHFSGSEVEEYDDKFGDRMFTGNIRHPMIDNNQPVTVVIRYESKSVSIYAQSVSALAAKIGL